MKRTARLLRLQACALLGATLVVTVLGGCPGGFLGFGGLLTVSASYSGEPTVDKTIDLVATIAGGTTPYTITWTQVSGPADALLTNADQATANFVPQAAGYYTFRVDVRDAASVARTGYAQVQIIVGDIQFVIPGGSAAVRIPGNPATLVYNQRDNLINTHEARVSVYDPEFLDDQRTNMTVTYEVISVPAEARTQDVNLDRDFDSINNQGTGDFDNSSGSVPTLDGVVNITFRPHPDATYRTLTNIATTMDNFGFFVPGTYTFRATVTNANGQQRTRDLVVQLSIESLSGSTGFIGQSAGPDTLAVKDLPLDLTNVVLTPLQTATMTATVFPATTTSYRFYLLDNNGVAYLNLLTQSAASATATGSPQDITLTIGAAAGLPVGTHTLYFESFDSLGELTNNPVRVNVGLAGGPQNVMFHVTEDYLAATSINAALVGGASNNALAPTDYQGWSGGNAGWGARSALADVNLDGVLDIVNLDTAASVAVRTEGYVMGNAGALRHPQNNGNLAAELPAPTQIINTGLAGATSLAVGDLNGDSLPDIAVNSVVGGAGRVVIYFHTGDPVQPYSHHDDQTLVITGPAYTRRYQDVNNYITAAPAGGLTAPATTNAGFGYRIAIAPVSGTDALADLIITDPGFSTLKFYGATGPTPAALVADFYNSGEGRVYVFNGGATGQLLPGRPDIVTSEILETGTTNAVPAAAAVAFTETNARYSVVYAGAEFNFLGYSLAANANGTAVGSPLAYATGVPFGTATFTEATVGAAGVPDNATVTITSGGIARIYEFDTNASGLTVGNVLVNVPAATFLNRNENAIIALRDAINADASRPANAVVNPNNATQLIFRSIFTNQDSVVRGVSTVASSMGGVAGGNFNYSLDGIVYRIAINTASGTVSGPITGTQNSGMGLGAELAKGDINGGGTDDLLIAACDSGADAGVSNGDQFIVAGADDGAVFFVWDATTALVAITGVGANTALAPAGGTVAATAVGAAVAIADVNDDGLAEAFFTEPGFDHIYMITGAAAPATTPNRTFTGVTFNNTPGAAPAGGSLAETGTFLFGDITGDTYLDWVYLSGNLNFGFAGFDR